MDYFTSNTIIIMKYFTINELTKNVHFAQNKFYIKPIDKIKKITIFAK